MFGEKVSAGLSRGEWVVGGEIVWKCLEYGLANVPRGDDAPSATPRHRHAKLRHATPSHATAAPS